MLTSMALHFSKGRGLRHERLRRIDDIMFVKPKMVAVRVSPISIGKSLRLLK
jgi:hypothetical protein